MNKTVVWAKLSKYSLDLAAAKLELYAQQLRESSRQLTDELRQVAAAEARTHFSENVTVSVSENGVIASGQSVVFEEFGAGARISDPFPGGSDTDMEIRRGAYSDLHEGPYAQSGYEFWEHDGERYEYITPRNALFYGMEAARDAAAEKEGEILNPAGLRRL